MVFRSRAILIVFGAVIVLFVASLPWQRRQWAQVARVRQLSALQETRNQQIAAAHQELAAAEERVRANPEDHEAHLTAARILAERRDVPRAAAHLRVLEAAVQRSPDRAHALSGLYQKIGYLDRALAMARLEKRLAPNSPSALLSLGFLYLQLGWRTQVRALFDEAAEHSPASAEPHLALAMWHEQAASDHEAAAKELAIADRLRPGDWQIALLIARNRMAQRQFDQALQIVEAAMRHSPAQPQLHVQKAQILYEKARLQSANNPGSLEAVIGAAQQCLLLDPNNMDARFVLGTVYRDRGDGARAIQEWERVLQNDPEYSGLSLKMGRLLVEEGQRPRGLALIAKSRRAQLDAEAFNRLVIRAGTSPENVTLRRELARWCQAHGRLSRAILEWEEVLARVPGDSEAERALPAAKRQRGDL
jgi:tetratricopeptide (TPR) repeat protein